MRPCSASRVILSLAVLVAAGSSLSCSANLVQKPDDNLQQALQAVPGSGFICFGSISDYMLIGGNSAFSVVLNRTDGPPEKKPRELLLVMKEVNRPYDGVFIVPAGTYRVTQVIGGPYDPLFGRSGGKEAAGTGVSFNDKVIDVKPGRASVLGLMTIHHQGWQAVGYTNRCVDAPLESRLQQRLSGVELYRDCLQFSHP
jgi:hypothetical protein